MFRKFKQPVRVVNGIREASSQSKLAPNFNYCLESVKSNDYEAYLATLAGPKQILRSAFAIRAFNIELLSILKYPRELNVSIAKVRNSIKT